MADSQSKRKVRTTDPALGAVDALGSELIAAAQARADRLRSAAERFYNGTKQRQEAEQLDASGIATQDEALATMAVDLDAQEIAKLLDIPTRSVTKAINRHRSHDKQQQGTGGGSASEPVDIRESAAATKEPTA